MPIKLFASTVIAALLMTGTVTPVSTPTGQGAQLPEKAAAAATLLTQEEAVAIALAHAGEAESAGLRARIDREDGVRCWELHWRSGDWEYDYDIDLTTGAVLDWERDYEPVPAAETRPTEPPAAEAPRAEKTTLTAGEAKAIALAHAGLTADRVRGLQAEYDRDDCAYEIEFRADGYEYDYEIHAETGRILEHDKERDD